LIVEAAKLDFRQYTVEYERLRSQVTGTVEKSGGDNAAGQPRGIGLALLLSEGIPGWLKAVEAVLRASPPRTVYLPAPSPREGSPPGSAVPAWPLSVQRHEVATLLASLVLSIGPVAHESPKEGYRSWS
jgi:hypothetical protein